MSDAGGVEIDGLDAAWASLSRWADQLADDLPRALQPDAQRVAALVRQKVPHLTGQLASTVSVDGVTFSMGEGLAYAGWIEFGGSRGRPYFPEGRYLYPTVDDAADELTAAAAAATSDSVERFSWPTPG